MVAVITGQGLGLARSSGATLGSRGQLGSAAVSAVDNAIYVNAANGDLIIQNTDEMLFGVGPDVALSRTYNSLGSNTGGNGANWLSSTARRLANLTGAVNTAGSALTRIAADGSDVLYTYNAGLGLYVGNEQGGAYDTVSYGAGTNLWTWTDGKSRVVETYDNANSSRLVGTVDTDGNSLTYTYTGALLTKITSKTTGGHAEYVTLTYQGANISSVVTSYWDAATNSNQTLTGVYYTYDASGRLTTVLADLTPKDNSVADGKTYWTVYEYDGTSNRISRARQSDGSILQISYLQVSGVYRVWTLTQTSATGVTRGTSFNYNIAGQTSVTDNLGNTTTLVYDAKGQLTQITAPPPAAGMAALVSTFAYDAMGNVLAMTKPGGATVRYTYDSNGNRLSQIDSAGVTVTWTYGANNQVLSQTQYLTPSPVVTDPNQAAGPVVTRYAYSASNHLRFAVSAEGRVTEYRYNALGQQVSAIDYTANVYPAPGVLTESALAAWVGAISDGNVSQRTDTAYDFRGNIQTVTAYGQMFATSAGDAPVAAETTVVNYIYDQFGRLLSRQPAGSAAETYVYDGLGRLISTVDFANHTTSAEFNDATFRTIVTLANGVTQTSIYDLAGELVSYVEAGGGIATATTSYKYDAVGRLRSKTDPTGLTTSYLYDSDDRKVADIQADGSIVEYGYTANGQINKTYHYKNKLTATQLAALVDANQNPATIELAWVRPAVDVADQWEWRIYDAAQRLIETIDAAGDAKVYQYDGASRLVSTTAYANRVMEPLSFNSVDLGADGPGLHLQKVGDFNGDGKADVFLRNDSGQMFVWASQAGGGFVSQYIGAGDPAFTVAAVGDFNGDGKADLLWRDNSGSVTLWNSIPGAGISFSGQSLAAMDSAWRVQQAGDFNGDGKADILFRHDSGTVLLWSSQPLGGYLTQDIGWSNPANTIGAVADFNGDGKADILWQQSNGDIAFWRSVVGTATTFTTQTSAIGTAWKVQQTGDLNGDGYADVLFRHDTGTALLWSSSPAGYVTQDIGWADPATMQLAAVGDYNGDGKADLLWQQLSGGQNTDVIVWNSNLGAALSAYAASPSSGLITPVADAAKDRVERYFYDGDGRLTGALDAEGFLTQTLYDAAGRKSQTIAYANAVTVGLRASGTFAQALASVGSNAKDIHNWSVYDGRGLLRATIDGEGDLTRYHYTPLGDVDQVVRGQQLSVATLLATPPTLANLPADTGTAALETTNYTRNAFGRVLTETKVLAGGQTELITYFYDLMQNLESSWSASWTSSNPANSADFRSTRQYYDARGELAWSVPAGGSDALSALGNSPTQAQVDAVLATYATSYAYDAAGRLISKTEPRGGDAEVHRTLYYYDARGQLAYAINPKGEVVKYAYDSFGQRTDVIVYGTRLSAATLSGLTGGLVGSSLISAIAAIANVDLDSQSHLDYNATGQVSRSIDATGAATTYAYDAFGGLASSTAQIDNYNTVRTDQTYDRRGLLISQVQDAATGGQRKTTWTTRDAFGRVLQTIDANNRVRTSGYDRAGRTVLTTDANNISTTYKYDGRGAMVELIDGTNAKTTFAYTAFNRTTTVTTPEGLATVTTVNAYGQVVKITDGAGRSTRYDYNTDGNLITTTDGLGNAVQSNYDTAGRLWHVIDARGVKTTFAYDAANRVLSRTIDDGGLNLITRYDYDAKGQQVTITDPALMVTTVSFDKSGRRTAVVVDAGAGHLALRTEYAYDKAGRLLTITEAAGTAVAKVTRNTYDKLGRLTQSQVDPTGLNLTTRYAYDGVGNVVATTDPAGGITRYVYDTENRQIRMVDPVGGVTATTYDAEGRITGQTTYAKKIAGAVLAGFGLAISVADASVATSASDQSSLSIYDGDGRLRFSIDAVKVPTEYVYDGAGNVIRQITYAWPVYATTLASVVSAVSGGSTLDHVTRAVYDAANRQVFSIDPAGFVTAFTYDAAGNVVKTRRYETAYTGAAANPSIADLQTWSANLSGAQIDDDRIDRIVYDGAGRAVYHVDALGYVSETQYDAAGRVQNTLRHAAAYAVADGVTQQTLQTQIGASAAATAVATYYYYDTAGRCYAVRDAMDNTTYSTLDALGNVLNITEAAGTSSAVTTYQSFDRAGRLEYATDGAGVTTRYVLDGDGRTLETYAAYARPGQVITHRTYDAAGNLSSETRAYGTVDAAKTGYDYDGAGRLLSVTNPRNYITTYDYYASGKVWHKTVPLADGVSAVTVFAYNAFGQQESLTDARGVTAYFYYDKLNRLKSQSLPSGGQTQFEYSLGGEISKIIGPLGATTRIDRDKLDRVVANTDAMNHAETYVLDAFGNRRDVTNRLGGVTHNTFDKLGRLLTETLPVGSWRADGSLQAANIVNRYVYDARGNLVWKVEADGLAEQRATNFVYDALDRVIEQISDAVQVLNPALNGLTTFVPHQKTSYDARGNVVETIIFGEAGDARTLYYYDALDRKNCEIDASGRLSIWTYDHAGAIISKVYGDVVALPATGSGPPAPIDANNYRQTTDAYDANNRLISTTVANLRTGQYVAGAYVTQVGSITTQIEYDAMGNITRQVDGRGGVTRHFYDALGRETAQIDAENYLTLYTRDAEGNVTLEERLATRLPDTIPTDLTTATRDPVSDRLTRFTYDQNGRRLTETRYSVDIGNVDATTGALTNTQTNATIIYSYNDMGEIYTKTQATSDYLVYHYDLMGRVTEIFNSPVAGAATYHRVAMLYDGLNNVVVSQEGANVQDAANDRFTRYTYGPGGRLQSLTDAEQFTRNFTYDAAGRLTREHYLRSGSTGAITEGKLYQYDLLGRVVTQAALTYGSTTPTIGDRTHFRYNAFGELTGKGMTTGVLAAGVAATPVYQETYEYDAGGRMWRSNAGDGVARLYLYDGAGAVTLTIASSGTADLPAANQVNLGVYVNLEAALSSLTLAGATGAAFKAGIVSTITVHDKRGLDAETRETFRELNVNAANPAIMDTGLIRRQRVYNAFGEVINEIDARGNTTDFTYNTLGKLTQKKGPSVSATAENGAAALTRPTETYAYDAAGRLVAVRDANNNLTTRRLLEGSGHDGQDALVTSERHADGGVVRTAYDIFSQASKVTDAMSADTLYGYDKMGRLITVTHPARGPATPGGAVAGLVDHYTYDGLGQRLLHWNSQFGATVYEATDYDVEGRVSRTTGYAGDVVSYLYQAYDNALTTAGLGTFGGLVKFTQANGRTSADTQDYFGRAIDHIDFGGNDYGYGYDKAGRLVHQDNSAGQNINYTYFNTGNMSGSADVSGHLYSYTTSNIQTKYAYDVEGNRTFEGYTGTAYYYDGYGGYHPYDLSYQNATATYDALNRVVSIVDSGQYGAYPMTINYEYDANGNVRHMASTYQNMNEFGVAVGSSPPQDYWYKYDTMNRFVTTKGVLAGERGGVSTTIVRGSNGVGTDIAYDLAGQRVLATISKPVSVIIHTTPNQYGAPTFDYETRYVAQREHYSYTEDGYLSTVSVDQDYYTYTTSGQGYPINPTLAAGTSTLLARNTRDLLGRVTSYAEYNTGGAVTYSRAVTYNVRSEITDETVVSSSVSSTVHNDYNLEATAGSGVYNGAYQGGVVTHTRTVSGSTISDSKTSYVWWDAAKQSQIAYKPSISATTTNTSSFSYDANGHLTSVWIADSRPRSVTYITDLSGQVMSRKEADQNGGTGDPNQLYYYFNGRRVGEIGNNGASETDYANGVTQRNASQSGPFRLGYASSAADFDQSFDPISPTSEGVADTRVTVREGDTLRSIALAVWGDESLWWMIAQANGLSSNDAVAAGMTLIVPAKVVNQHNTSKTFRVYDPNQAIGDVSPTSPAQVKPQGKKGCGTVGTIITIAIAVAVSFATFHALDGFIVNTTTAILAGAVAGAAGSVASQGFAIAVGNQEKFSWKGVALAAVAGGVGAGVGFNPALKEVLSHSNAFVSGLARGAIGNAITQGVSVAVGLQDHFDWKGVAVGAAVGGVTAGMNFKLGNVGDAIKPWSLTGLGDSLVSGAAGAVAGAATRSLLDGSDFGDNILKTLPDVIGSTIGNAIGGRLAADRTVRPVNAVSVDDAAQGPLQAWHPDDPGTLSQAPFIDASDLSYDYSDTGHATEDLVHPEAGSWGASSLYGGDLINAGFSQSDQARLMWNMFTDPRQAERMLGDMSLDRTEGLLGAFGQALGGKMPSEVAATGAQKMGLRNNLSPLLKAYVLKAAQSDPDRLMAFDINNPGLIDNITGEDWAFKPQLLRGAMTGYIRGELSGEAFSDAVQKSSYDYIRRAKNEPLDGPSVQVWSMVIAMGGGQGGAPLLSRGRIDAHFQTLSRFEPYARSTMSPAQKGALGEQRAAVAFTRAGYEQMETKLPGNQGFDGVWVKNGTNGKPVHIIIGESKFSTTGKSSLATTKGRGRQMSDQWIQGTIDQMVRSSDSAVRATARLLQNNRSIIDLKINVLNGQGINRWNVLKALRRRLCLRHRRPVLREACDLKMAVDEDHLKVLREEHIEDMPILRENAADPAKDRRGESASSLAGAVRRVAIISYLLDRDSSKFRTQLAEYVLLKLRFFKRYDAGDGIDGSYISMFAYTNLLDALATGDEALAKTFANQMGGRPELEETYDSPFSIAMGYTLKYAVADDAVSAAPHVKALEALCRQDEFSSFLGYPLMIQALFDRDLEAAQAGVAELLRGHKRESRRGGEFHENLDGDLYVWGVGIVNLLRLRGPPLGVDDPCIPADLLAPMR